MKTDVDELIVYQIYPKSFCDTDGDGFGDIEGILSKIGYLKNLGVNAVWITPWFKSPNVDNGYDVSDYRDIDENIGTLAQAETLIRRFHENGIAVILDLVANHTSTKHEWFRRSRSSKDDPYRDYYIWRKTPPNDWQSVFGGSAWEKDGATGEYYLHSFAVEQADLNWDNPNVRKEMQAVVDFWLSKGVDGFRCDMLDMISKDIEGGKNGNGPRLHEYIRGLFGREETDGIFTVGECWSASKENARLFCAKERKELTTVFAFHHLCLEEISSIWENRRSKRCAVAFPIGSLPCRRRGSLRRCFWEITINPAPSAVSATIKRCATKARRCLRLWCFCTAACPLFFKARSWGLPIPVTRG